MDTASYRLRIGDEGTVDPSLETLTDRVQPKDYQRYREQVVQLLNELGYANFSDATSDMAAALVMAFSKTGMPGSAILAVMLMAHAFPGSERLSVGVMVPLLLLPRANASRLTTAACCCCCAPPAVLFFIFW